MNWSYAISGVVMEEQQQRQVVLGGGGHGRYGFCLRAFFRPRRGQKSYENWVPIHTPPWQPSRHASS